jgi:hypothetical protein
MPKPQAAAARKAEEAAPAVAGAARGAAAAGATGGGGRGPRRPAPPPSPPPPSLSVPYLVHFNLAHGVEIVNGEHQPRPRERPLAKHRRLKITKDRREHKRAGHLHLSRPHPRASCFMPRPTQIRTKTDAQRARAAKLARDARARKKREAAAAPVTVVTPCVATTLIPCVSVRAREGGAPGPGGRSGARGAPLIPPAAPLPAPPTGERACLAPPRRSTGGAVR